MLGCVAASLYIERMTPHELKRVQTRKNTNANNVADGVDLLSIKDKTILRRLVRAKVRRDQWINYLFGDTDTYDIEAQKALRIR